MLLSHVSHSNRRPLGQSPNVRRRTFLQGIALGALGTLSSPVAAQAQDPRATEGGGRRAGPTVRTVLGRVAPDRLGLTLMHEHAPVVDWSELYEMPHGPIAPIREDMLTTLARQLDAFHTTLGEPWGPGAIVECTPIRVGRDPHLLVALAKRVPVHIIACTGFWCEALAPQHPWVIRLGVEHDGIKKLAGLFIREITEGMEDPSGRWGERFTDIPAGIIKCATSTFLRPSERRCHEAAAIASKETGCPITTHTTNGGGWEQARFLIQRGAQPEKIIIGHQGHQDDRRQDEAHEYHRRIASLGCSVQFDRVGEALYSPAKVARQIKHLVEVGHTTQILVGHDHVPYFYQDYAADQKTVEGWRSTPSDFTIVPTQLVDAMKSAQISSKDIHTILVHNPQRVLAF